MRAVALALVMLVAGCGRVLEPPPPTMCEDRPVRDAQDRPVSTITICV